MKNLILTIDMLPKGAWDNDFSRTLPKKEWDILRTACYKRANHQCQICGYSTDDLNAHEIWEFNTKNKTQTLIDIIGICNKCHGLKHIRNTQRLGYEEEAKKHFMKVNNCNELDYASCLAQAQISFNEQNKIYRWKIIADLTKFGLKNATIKKRNIPFIKSIYENIDWEMISFEDKKKLFQLCQASPPKYWFTPPKVISIAINNYQGTIDVLCDDTNKIVWYLDNIKIKTKYNIVGKFKTTLKVENLKGKELTFALVGDGGQALSKTFELIDQEVI